MSLAVCRGLALGIGLACGDFAFESGTLFLKGKDGAVVDRGKYVVVWKREEGRWKLHRDIFNTNLAPLAR